MTHTDIVLVGVGGQGTLLASRVLGALAVLAGRDVKVSEVHGMAQRGGSVVTYVRLGEGVCAPLVEAAGADYVLAFEQMEAVRALPYLKAGGTMIVNTQKIPPMPVITGAASYPSDLLSRLEGKCRLVTMDALALAEQAGVARAVNLALLGKLSAMMDFEQQDWLRAIEQCVPQKVLEANLRAFELGSQA